MTEPGERRVPPGEVAKIATAGATGVFIFGLAAVMGWAERPAGEPAVIPVLPATTVSAPVAPPSVLAPTTTTSLVPLATTVPAAPAPVPAPAPPVVAAPPPPAPIVVVSEQSQ